MIATVGFPYDSAVDPSFLSADLCEFTSNHFRRIVFQNSWNRVLKENSIHVCCILFKKIQRRYRKSGNKKV